MSQEEQQDETHPEETIEVKASVYDRFEEERSETASEYIPEMDPTAFLDSLLDTREAVQQGYYQDIEVSEE